MRWGGADPALLRQRMVDRDVVGRGVTDPRVVAAMLMVPRHAFVDEALAARAYADEALPIGAGQTISRPSTVALMTALLLPAASDKVLEIGTGSGYQAAVLARLCAGVDSVERVPALARRARAIFRRLRIDNVRVFHGDGSRGRGSSAKYDRIIVTAGSPALPEALVQQLADGGRLVAPVADGAGGERLHVVERAGDRVVTTATVPCSFVPLIGASGYAEREQQRP